MGYKTRMVPEKYFIMELEDLIIAIKIFHRENFKEPRLILLHPDSSEEVRCEAYLKMAETRCDSGKNDGKPMMFMGIEIKESFQVKKEKVEVY